MRIRLQHVSRHGGASAAILVAALFASGCTRTVAPPPVAATLAPAAPAVAAMPAGGRPGMTIPARAADGGWFTPNRALSRDAAVWHLRTALNVAALACRGSQEAALAAGYNRWLAARSARLKSAEAALSAQYRAGGADWQDRYDDSMTRLYNFWAQDFARAGFCAAAIDTLAAPEPADFDAFAVERLAAMEKPFTDFFAAYDAWRRGAAGTPVRYAAPASSVAVATSAAAPAVSMAVPAPAPMLAVDVTSLR